MTRSAVIAIAFLVGYPIILFADDKISSKTIDSLAEDALKRWHAPGLAIVLVRNDEVVHLQGYGLRELGKKDPVTPDTLFALASLTKAFAATGIGLLAEDGKADFDDKVSKHLPGFRLFDPLADREVRLRDLLCHRTGLSRHDLLWARAPWSIDETVKRMAHLEPTHSFRAKYDYCNLTYIVAGQAAAKAAGVSWEQFTRDRLLGPMGMKTAAFTRKEVFASKDYAIPHRVNAGKVQPIEWYPDEGQIRASGSIKACAREMAAWLRVNLNDGMLGTKRILAARTLRELHSPQVVMPVEGAVAKHANTTQQSYALGWRMSDYRGKTILEHGGAADGFRARIVLLPKQKTGFVLFTNLEETLMMSAMGNLLLDELMGGGKTDWHEIYLKQRESVEQSRAAAHEALLATRKKETRPSREQKAYTGIYRDAAYGEATVKETDKGLVLAWSSFQVPLVHFHYDTFHIEQPERLAGLARFELGRDGEVAMLHLLGRKFVRGK